MRLAPPRTVCPKCGRKTCERTETTGGGYQDECLNPMCAYLMRWMPKGKLYEAKRQDTEQVGRDGSLRGVFKTRKR